MTDIRQGIGRRFQEQAREQTWLMRSRWSLLLLALMAMLLPSPRATAETLRAVVVSVGDGDTIRVRRDSAILTVRLACIDAPETAQRPYGEQARRQLRQRLPVGQPVMLEIKTTDRYGRSVAEVFSGGNINLAMVSAGQAFAYRQYLSGCNAKAYLEAEAVASRQRRGVWQVTGGITRPWDFRRGRRTAVIHDGSTPDGHRWRCREIGSLAQAQRLLAQGHHYLDSDGDGQACESLVPAGQ